MDGLLFTAQNMDTIKKVYEVGYLIVSSIPEEKVGVEVEAIEAIVAKEKGEIISGEKPALKELAYTMIKEATGRHHRFTEGYFGWIKFEIATDSIEAVKKAIDARENILRYILMITVRESTLAPQKVLVVKEALEPKKEDGVTAFEEAKVVVSSEELDKTIDEMIK